MRTAFQWRIVGHRPLAETSAYTALTEREREVLQLLAEGRSQIPLDLPFLKGDAHARGS